MMKVPFSVIIGKSPMKTVCSLISPVLAFMNRARTKIGAEKVMSFSLQSSSVNLGGGRRSSSFGSNSSSRESVSVTSVIGLRSEKVPDRPCSTSQSNDSICTAIRSGSSRTSSRLPNEYLSRTRGRDDTSNSWPGLRATGMRERAKQRREICTTSRGDHGERDASGFTRPYATPHGQAKPATQRGAQHRRG